MQDRVLQAGLDSFHNKWLVAIWALLQNSQYFDTRLIPIKAQRCEKQKLHHMNKSKTVDAKRQLDRNMQLEVVPLRCRWLQVPECKQMVIRVTCSQVWH